MQPTLRALYSLEVDNLAAHRPDDEAFFLTVRVDIGPADGPGAETFDFDVCSIAWLRRELQDDEAVSGRFRLIMTEFSLSVVEQFVRDRVAQASGADWTEVAGKLGGWFRWEFDGYAARPSRRQPNAKSID